MESIELGKKIVNLRNQRGLSIRQLAEKTNVTSSLLSQIERGLANPSLNTLRMIASALEIPLFSFFIEAVDTKDLIVRADTRKQITFPSNNGEYSLLSPDLSGALEMMLMKLPPRTQSAEHPMAHAGEEVAYILQSEVVLYLADSVEVLHVGDSVKFPPGIKHKWENKGDTEAIIIFAITPPTF
ncbi:MAG: helix-turn-helix domain-containing protein [Negativicutes bacterium]|nr:helix-turn-helix domain-containing protein [Negativicutes bacterium]